MRSRVASRGGRRSGASRHGDHREPAHSGFLSPPVSAAGGSNESGTRRRCLFIERYRKNTATKNTRSTTSPTGVDLPKSSPRPPGSSGVGVGWATSATGEPPEDSRAGTGPAYGGI